MMRTILFLIFSAYSFMLAAQATKELDSLQTFLNDKNCTTETRIKIYLKLAHFYFNNAPQKALEYSDTALTIAINSKERSPFLPQIYLYRSTAYKNQSLNAEAIKNINFGLTEVAKIPNKKIEAQLYFNLANVNAQMSEQTQALVYNQKALSIFIELKDTLGIIDTYNDIGVIYWDKHEYEKAREYYKKSVQLNTKIGNSISNARSLNNIGLLFKEADQHDSALFYFKTALKKLEGIKNEMGVALINNNIGIVYRETNQYSLAFAHFKIAKELQLKLKDNYGIGLSDQNIADTYFIQHDYNKSLSYLKEGLIYAKKTNNLKLLHDLTERLASNYEQLKEYKNAFDCQKQAKLYYDSLESNSLSNKIAELEVKFQVKQKQAENDFLKVENQLQLILIKNSYFWIVGIIVFSILLATLLVLVYHSLLVRKRATATITEKNTLLEALYKELEQQKKSIEEQKDEIARQNQQLTAKNKYLQELNAEKNSLMGIVAHDLKAPFHSISGITQLFPKFGSLTKQQEEFLALISNVVDGGISLIRDLIDLSELENKDVKIRIEKVYINSILNSLSLKFKAMAEQKGIQFEVITLIDSTFYINSNGQYLDRILQNLISNALKFSNSGTKVVLGASTETDLVNFYVKDQGPGISNNDQKKLFKKFQKLTARPTNGETSSGLGLSIVKALLDELKGSILVESELGKGTSFICSLPLS